MNRDEALQDAYHKLAFCASCVRQEIRSGGEAIKALEILEREVNKAIAALSSPCACGGRTPIAVVRTIAWRKPHGQIFITADTKHVHLGEAGSKSTLDELTNVTVIVIEGWPLCVAAPPEEKPCS